MVSPHQQPVIVNPTPVQSTPYYFEIISLHHQFATSPYGPFPLWAILYFHSLIP